MNPDLEWSLRLFVSADLVGSTAFKHGYREPDESSWMETFREFFETFPNTVSGQYERYLDALGESQAKALVGHDVLTTWKFNGDEVLLQVRLHRYEESLLHVLAARDAALQCPGRWTRKGCTLGVKLTAWLAGFPVTNCIVRLPLGASDGREVVDYLGPSMDLGFRLTHAADEGRFPLAADLALMLLHARGALRMDEPKLYYDGRLALKGVTGGSPYPLVWMAGTNPNLLHLEHQALGRRIGGGALEAFLGAYLDGTPGLRRPFISGDPDAMHGYGLIPVDLASERAAMLAAQEAERRYSETLPQAARHTAADIAEAVRRLRRRPPAEPEA